MLCLPLLLPNHLYVVHIVQIGDLLRHPLRLRFPTFLDLDIQVFISPLVGVTRFERVTSTSQK